MERLISNPDLIKHMYEFKINGEEKDTFFEQLHDHSIRVTLLAIATGLQLRWSIISLVNVGMAGILHDMGILRTSIFPKLDKLDDCLPNELENFVEEHQRMSVDLFGEKKVTLLPFTKQEIVHMIANHHRPDLNDMRHKTTILLYFAELVDEMITVMPHKARYNFSPDQVKKLGDRFARRNGLMNVILALIKLYKGKGLAWQIITQMISLFSLDELLIEGYEEKLKEIIDFCPFNSAVAYPPAGGNALPRTIYCNNSLDSKFSCEHMSQVKIEIYVGAGKVKSYNKCNTLTDRLHGMNKAGREQAEEMSLKGKAERTAEIREGEKAVKNVEKAESDQAKPTGEEPQGGAAETSAETG